MGCGKIDKVEGKHDHDCICEVVRYIKRVQDLSDNNDDCNECGNDCFMAPLGSVSPSRANVNTRAFMLVDKHGKPFKALYKRAFGPGCHYGESVFFRVQSIFDGCCATLQVLEPRNGNDPVDLFDCDGNLIVGNLCNIDRFRRTETCITVDLDCFCGIQCFLDTFVDLCPN